ncbi:sensor histidine kinase [Rivibacter subsaxonicus]|uniref:histidine kinase n=1 Tax=Rivibacter subsaxonicus TaxID=457575 RepID=A0A4Q7VGP4_9BURK|nr:sensor histidine kinase [Rivibacter subsaxonicus]RZT95211.1 two-component system sensor histidine kinase TctE [Rivibacter subsaxonicus]
MLRSLKATLLLSVFLLTVLIAPVRVWLNARQEISRGVDAFDQALTDTAFGLGAQILPASGPEPKPGFELHPQAEALLRANQTERVWYAVLEPGGGLIGGDAALAAVPTPGGPGDARRAVDVAIGTEPARMVSLAVDCGLELPCEVRVAESMGRREAARSEAVRGIVLLSVAAVLCFALAIWAVVSYAMRPLKSINRQLSERSLDDLRPLARGRAPSEVRPLLDAIDQLLRRVAGESARQRHFIADAAHQLRTPLTALRTEAELALLEAHPHEIDATLRRVHRSAERAARLAEQLLALARSEASRRDPVAGEPVDLKAMAQEAAQDWVPRALERGADLGFQLAPVMVRARAELLRELLGNLVHNALEYAQGAEGGARITVRTRADGGRAVLEVEDNGPGVAVADRERVFERFYRAAGAPGNGSGLGLAIVRDIAGAHGGTVELLDANEGGGLLVRVSFARL